MAEEDLGQSRTEAPTDRRREESRQQGQVAVSTDLSSGIIVLTAVLALWLGANALAGGLVDSLRSDALAHGIPLELGPLQVQNLFALLFRQGLSIMGVLLSLLFVVGLAVGVLQAGFHVVPDLVAFNFDRLSPVNGWSRIFSLAASVRGLSALLKVIAIALVAYWVLKNQTARIASLHEGTIASATAQGWSMIMRVSLAIAIALVVIGIADYGFQRWRLEQSLRMTRQELKEELKREEGDPLIKARIRRLQRERAQRRMLEEVPRAAVVITNPTHLAIALRYERGTMPAPKVVAKGSGLVAQRIVDLARRHAVPVVERKPLAQTLFKAVQIDQEISAALYHAVAEVLAYIYRLRGTI